MEVSNGSGWASADVVRIVEAAHRFATKHAAANGSGRPLLAGMAQHTTVMALPPSLSIRRSSYVRCYHHDSRLTLMLESPSTAKATPLEAIATGSVGQRKLIRQAVYAVARTYCTCDSADEGLDALIESESLVLTLKTSKDKKDTQRAKLTRLAQTMTNARDDLARSQREVERLTTYLAESEKERARLIEALDKAGRKRGG
jgi:hypothetical protein